MRRTPSGAFDARAYEYMTIQQTDDPAADAARDRELLAASWELFATVPPSPERGQLGTRHYRRLRVRLGR